MAKPASARSPTRGASSTRTVGVAGRRAGRKSAMHPAHAAHAFFAARATAETFHAQGTAHGTAGAHHPSHSKWLTAFDHFAASVTRWAGSPLAFCLALMVVLVWAVTGPLFDYSENWQLVINTGTTIVTFLMVFLIQQSQNKDSVAVHLKLDELLAANREASNRMIGIEDMDEQDLRDTAIFYATLAEQAQARGANHQAQSIDDDGAALAKRPQRKA